MHIYKSRVALRAMAATSIAIFLAGFFGREGHGEELHWWKGNLHTHTLWSDGDAYPEVVTAWYKNNGYDFLGLSEHNIISQGQKWVVPEKNSFAVRGGGKVALKSYRDQFGDDWIETRMNAKGELEVRLKPLSEFRTLFEEHNRFLLIPSEEISDAGLIHVVATNVIDIIQPQGGETPRVKIIRNIEAVKLQSQETGQVMISHLAHPGILGTLAAEDIAPVKDLAFFEVYNGVRGLGIQGDATHASPERVWDIVLTKRLGELGLGVIYGLAVDDAHDYLQSTRDQAQPGRGWIMVRAKSLTPEHLLAAMKVGDFYASTGVTLRHLERSTDRIAIGVEAEAGVEYVIQFIGTRRGYARESQPVSDSSGKPLSVTRKYSNEIGAILKEVRGGTGEYEFQGDEIYVRVKVTSSKIREEQAEAAWVQPIILGEK